MAVRDEVTELLKLDTRELAGEINYIDAAIYLRETYDANFGLETGDSGVEMDPSEMIVANSLYEHWAEMFIERQIGDYFKMSFDDYVNRPREMLMSLNRIAERIGNKDADIAEKIKA